MHPLSLPWRFGDQRLGVDLDVAAQERLIGLDVRCDGRVGSHFVTCVGAMFERLDLITVFAVQF